MNKLFIILIFGSHIFADINDKLLNSMLDNDSWKFSEEKNGYVVFEKQFSDKTIFMVKKQININKEKIFEVIADIGNYSQILTSTNVINDYLGKNNNKLYGYQKFTNFIPFVKNRQIIFEMNKMNDDIISWVLLDSNHPYFDKYDDRKIKTLSFGAGIWQYLYVDNKQYIVHKFFVDPKLNIPKFIINRAAQNNVIHVVEDILNYAEKTNNN